MKKDRLKFSIFCLVVFCILCLPASQISLLGYVPNDSTIYTFYTIDNVSNISNANVVKNGNSFIVSCDSSVANEVRNNLTSILGESVLLKNPTKNDLQNLTNKIYNKFLFKETLQNAEILYCYEPTLPKYVVVNNKKVNLQIAINTDSVIIGYPLILGSF